jgi:hypothetical protein
MDEFDFDELAFDGPDDDEEHATGSRASSARRSRTDG